MSHTWPELRRFCRERQKVLVEVDLRWGITEEQSTRDEILKLCLDEIESCRPFFIGLLGERYGWVPGSDAFSGDLKEEQLWLKGLRGRSITELEILHGVLNNPDMATRAFFYFRDPKYAESMPASKRGVFLAENAESAEKQRQLKALIKKTCARRNIPVRENYPDPIKLATLVLDDLKAAIEGQFPKGEVPDVLTREAQDHEAFAETRRLTYIGRTEYLEALDRHAVGNTGPLVLVGDSGCGKSALLANWVEHWRKKSPKDFIVQHCIGGTIDSTDHWQVMKRVMGEIKRWTIDPENVPTRHDDMTKEFPFWLAKANSWAVHEGVRIVLVFDGLNQLDDKDHARLLGWLPEHAFTDHVRLIVSTLPGKSGTNDTLRAIQQRHWRELHIQPLTVEERRRMIADYLARFSKKLDEHRLVRLSSATSTANPLYLKILLDDLRVTGTHDNLDQRLSEYLAAQDVPALLRQVLVRYQRDYERDRPGLVGDALGLIWGARRGLLETELLQLLGPRSQSSIGNQQSASRQLPAAIWAPLRAALEDSLVDRGGVLNFAHDFLRTAVETAFVHDTNIQTSFRLQLVDYFEAQPATMRACDELPWLLRQANLRDRLQSCLLDIERFQLIRANDQEELLSYWVWLRKERAMGKLYLHSFERWTEKGVGDSNLVETANDLGSFLNYASLFIDAEPLLRRAMTIAQRSMGAFAPILSAILTNLMDLLGETNRLKEAEPLMRQALSLDEERYGTDHFRIAQDLNNLGHLLLTSDRLAEAEPLFRRALSICEQNNFPSDHPSVAVFTSNLANLLKHTNRQTEAEPLMRQVLASAQRHFGPTHPSVALRMNNLALLLLETNRAEEAARMAQEALSISEQTYGSNHPEVAIQLNTLARSLMGRNNLREAEPLMRRHLEIFLAFTDRTGHQHPHLQSALVNYATLLERTGMTRDQIREKLNTICGSHRVDPDILYSPVAGSDEHIRRKLQALLSRMEKDPHQAREIYERLRTEDPDFFRLIHSLIETHLRNTD